MNLSLLMRLRSGAVGGKGQRWTSIDGHRSAAGAAVIERFGPDTWVTPNARDIGDTNVGSWVTKSRDPGDQTAERSVSDGSDIGELDGDEETTGSRDMGNAEASFSGNALDEDISDG